MKRKLLIKILESLEEAYPNSLNIEKMIKRINFSSSKKEFFKVIKYLKETEKIVPLNKTYITINYELTPEDNVEITPQGIDFLSRINELDADDKRNKTLTKATVVLALVGAMQALTFFEQFSNNIRDYYDFLALVAMGFMLIIVVMVSWSAFTSMIFHKN